MIMMMMTRITMEMTAMMIIVMIVKNNLVNNFDGVNVIVLMKIIVMKMVM